MAGGTLNGYINSDGRLTLRGATLLGIDPATQFVPITRQHVLNWQNEKRVNGSEMTRTAFAREHNISGQIFTQLVNANGTPKYGWETRLEGDAVVRRPTSSIIRAVQQWLAPQNRVMGLQHFALARELHENSLRNYVDAHGVLNAQGQRWLDPRTGQLTAAGQNLIDSQIAPVTTDLIEAWRRIALEAPPRGSLEKFLAEHHLTRSSFSMYIRTDGTLTPVGEKKLARERNARPAAPPEQIAESSSASAPRPADGQNLAARYNPVDSEILQGFMELPASQQGIAGWQRHASRNALQPDDWSQSMMPDGVLRPSGWETFAQSRTRPDTALPDTSRVRLEIDNNALLFPDIDDASINRFEHYVWDIDELQVTDWGILEDSLRSLPANQAAAIKTRLELDFSEWLQSEKDDALADRNYENRFNALMTLDWAGNAPFIKAAKKLPQPFVVLGPYRGELRLSDTTLENTFTQNARRHVLSHLFAIRSGRPVSELSIRGNVISLINTNQLPGGDSLSGPDKFASPNVAVVRVEDTVYFYVTTRPIEKGEELLVDYESVDKRTSDAVAPASSQAEERRGAPIPREDAIANIGEANAALVDAPMSLQDTIASIRRLNSWRSIDADLVPALAGDLLYNTMGQGVAIRLQGETALNPMRIVPYDSVNPLVMELRDLGTPTAHYSGTYRAADGRLQTWNTPGGGDCFYYALYGTLYNRDPNLAPRTAIQDLRNRIADTLEQNYWRYYAFLNTEGNPRQNPGN